LAPAANWRSALVEAAAPRRDRFPRKKTYTGRADTWQNSRTCSRRAAELAAGHANNERLRDGVIIVDRREAPNAQSTLLNALARRDGDRSALC
jgi:hypothetical protein